MKALLCFLLIASVVALACSKQNDGGSFTTDCTTTKSFATDVSPLIKTYCATNSGCHASGSREGVYTTYQQVYNDRSAIRRSVASYTMPQGMSMSTEQRNAIICWIDNGAANN